MKKIIITAAIISLSALYMSAQGYNIEVKIKNYQNQNIYLAYHKATQTALIPRDTTKLDKSGYGIFKGKEKLQEGMYVIFLPTKSTYFTFFIGKDQTFKIETDTTNLYEKLNITEDSENKIAKEYQKHLLKYNEKIKTLQNNYKAETDSIKKLAIEKKIKTEIDKNDTYIDDFAKKHPDNYFPKFIKATTFFKIPETIEKEQAIQYFKHRYFDNFDISDKSLFYSPIYENKLDYYLDNIDKIAGGPDSIINIVDLLLAKTQKDEEMYQYMLLHLFNRYAKSKLIISENIYVHLADTLILKATKVQDSFKNELKTKIIRKKNSLIDKQALPLHMFIVPNDSNSIEQLRAPLEDMKTRGLEIEKDKSRTFDQKLPELSQLISEYSAYFNQDANLYDIKTKYTILWFISPDCSHCIEETPKLYEKYVSELKDLNTTVWAVFLEANTDNWAKYSDLFSKWYNFIQKHKMYEKGWYNVWNSFENHRFKYDISSSPVLYILDENKKIIAKKIGYEQAIDLIKIIEENKNEKNNNSPN